MTFMIKRGDLLPRLVYQLKNPDETPANLAGCTVVFNMNHEDGTPQVVRSPAVITTAATGMVEYSWMAGDTALVGPFNGEFEVIYPGNLPMTYPNDDNHIDIKISPDLG